MNQISFYIASLPIMFIQLFEYDDEKTNPHSQFGQKIHLSLNER